MSDEIQEAVQIIRVAYEGIEIAMKVGNGGISAMQRAVEVLKGMLDYEKTLGKTSMKKLLMKGGDLQVFQFQSEEIKKVEKLAKKYGILYSVLPDVNRTDGMSEVIFHSEAVPRVNMMVQKLKFGRIATFDEYLKNGNEKELGKLLDFLKGQRQGKTENSIFPGKIYTDDSSRSGVIIEGLIEKVGLYAMEKQTISVDAVKENFGVGSEQAQNVIKQLETIGVLDKGDHSGQHKVIMDKEAFTKRIIGYQNLAERMRAVSASKNSNLSDVTISRTLIANESETAVKTRVPGTYGDNVRYIWINKENIMDIHNGKTILTFLDKNEQYKLYDEDNRIIATMKGEELYSNHYDKVESSLRERYQKSMSGSKEKNPIKTEKRKER